MLKPNARLIVLLSLFSACTTLPEEKEPLAKTSTVEIIAKPGHRSFVERDEYDQD